METGAGGRLAVFLREKPIGPFQGPP